MYSFIIRDVDFYLTESCPLHFRIYFLFLILFFSGKYSLAADSFKPYSAYITNVEDDDAPITVFKTPGQNWKYCTKDPDIRPGCVEAIGWPGRDAKITVLGETTKATARDFTTGKFYEEEYLKVKFTYDRKGADGKLHHQEGVGYIEKDYIAKAKTKSFYTAQNTNKAEVPCPSDKKDSQAQLKNATAPLKDLAASTMNLSLEKKAAALSEVVGFCPLKPPTKTPGPFKGKENVYDQAILPTLLKSKVPPVRNEAGQLMTRDELIQIDTLARTLYGEMALCYRRGLQYPMAVAKVILNRTDNEELRKDFIKGERSSKAPPLTQICTTPSQFSMWLKTIKGEPNETLHHGLCPPLSEGEPFWASTKASKFESDIWKNTMRIATEAILYPKKFKARTKEVDGYFYTSGVGKLGKFKKQVPTPSIEGQKLDRTACMEFWK